jgi:methyl-accepting chemotaxis protein
MTALSQNDLQTRLDFVGLDDVARHRLAAASASIKSHLEPALDRFYSKLKEEPAVAGFFSSEGQVGRAQSKQVGHWQAIAEGRLDDDYFTASTKVGLVHARIGLEPRWHIGGYSLIMETLVRGLMADGVAEILTPKKGAFGRSVPPSSAEIETKMAAFSETLISVLKTIMLDVDIGVSAYFAKVSQETEAASAGARAKIQQAVSATGSVLQDVARGDLRSRVEEKLDPEFEQIKHDTNAVAERLTTIVSQLQQTSRSIKVASTEILSGVNDLADRTTRQAATIEQTTASIEQLASAVDDNAGRAATASEKAQNVARNATSGGEAMEAANEAMTAIETSSAKISNIIGLIDDIAFQTNLLALNASVEAARAGDAGKGFAVVAVEVRRLAQSAANASSEVKKLIEASASEVRKGAQLVSRASEVLLDILGGARESAVLIDSIAQASRNQALSLGEVKVAVRQMDEMTQHNAALVEETNAAIEQTDGQVGQLDRIVDVFQISGQDRIGTSQRPATRPAEARGLRTVNGGISSDWNEF